MEHKQLNQGLSSVPPGQFGGSFTLTVRCYDDSSHQGLLTNMTPSFRPALPRVFGRILRARHPMQAINSERPTSQSMGLECCKCDKRKTCACRLYQLNAVLVYVSSVHPWTNAPCTRSQSQIAKSKEVIPVPGLYDVCTTAHVNVVSPHQWLPLP